MCMLELLVDFVQADLPLIGRNRYKARLECWRLDLKTKEFQ